MTAAFAGTLLDRVERATLRSANTGSDYQLIVSRPAAQDPPPGCLVVLDAPWAIGTAIESAGLQALGGEALPLIVIGVGAASIEEQGPLRMRDFSLPRDDAWYEEAARSGPPAIQMVLRNLAERGIPPQQAMGGAPRFARFLSHELYPKLVSEFGADPGALGVFGHSAAGGFLNYLMLQEDNPFNRLIMGSSTSDAFEPRPDARLQALAQRDRERKLRVLSGFGGLELETRELGPMFRTVMKVHEELNEQAAGKIEILTRVFQNESHTSVLPAVLASGIRELWPSGRLFGD